MSSFSNRKHVPPLDTGKVKDIKTTGEAEGRRTPSESDGGRNGVGNRLGVTGKGEMKVTINVGIAICSRKYFSNVTNRAVSSGQIFVPSESHQTVFIHTQLFQLIFSFTRKLQQL
ncbi:hypothetical protein Q1695_011689 [Nippostrongylus brasiliensis]|nr:hypothetical protein Q1695_011689 [Nippostrongylus brasiliensis]